MYDPARIKRLRDGNAGEDDRDGARYLIDELQKASIRGAKDPTGTNGSRYRELMVALQATTERLDIKFAPERDSLGALVKLHPEIATGGSLIAGVVARRQFEPLLEALDEPADRQVLEPIGLPQTGWDRVDQDIAELRKNAAGATSGHDRGAVGRLCREVLVSVAKTAYDEDRHGPLSEREEGAGGGTVMRKLEAILAKEASGSSHAELRSVLRKTMEFANTIQHRAGASDAEAMICADITIALTAAFRRLVPQPPQSSE